MSYWNFSKTEDNNLGSWCIRIQGWCRLNNGTEWNKNHLIVLIFWVYHVWFSGFSNNNIRFADNLPILWLITLEILTHIICKYFIIGMFFVVSGRYSTEHIEWEWNEKYTLMIFFVQVTLFQWIAGLESDYFDAKVVSLLRVRPSMYTYVCKIVCIHFLTPLATDSDGRYVYRGTASFCKESFTEIILKNHKLVLQ